LKKTCPGATLSSTNPTWPNQQLTTCPMAQPQVVSFMSWMFYPLEKEPPLWKRKISCSYQESNPNCSDHSSTLHWLWHSSSHEYPFSF
jgi:hypothetical protein